MKPLQSLRVVEVGGTIAGAYCAKLFVDQGADVALVGSSGLTPHQALYLHRGKQAVEQLEAGDLAGADVVIESSMDGLAAASSVAAPDTAVHVRISPYGSQGPRAHWRGSDLTDYAAGGHLYLYGDPDREPLRGPANQPAYAAGLFGFIGAMAALLARRSLGRGEQIDVSHVQVMAALHQFTLVSYLMTGHVARRMGNRYTGQGQPNGIYPCADGWISIATPLAHQVEVLLAVTELDHLMATPGITSVLDFQLQPGLLDEPLIEWLADKTMAEVTDLFQTMRIPTGPSLSMLQLLDDPQLLARDFFGGDAGWPSGLRAPKTPFTITPKAGSDGSTWTPGSVDDGPLTGLRILDLTRVWAGPLCARTLSDLGADVTVVEAPWARGPRALPASAVAASRFYPNDDPGECSWNRSSHTNKYALGKKSLAIDLNTEAGKNAFARIVPQHHVVIENFSTRVMPQLGFDEERLHSLNPALVYVTMPGFGRSGPAEHWVAYGSSVDTHAGLSNLIGYRDQSPWKGGVAWPDPVAGLHATSAILVALWHQVDGAGGGHTIEAAQFESTIAVIGDRIIEAQLDGEPTSDGNRSPGAFVEGVYPSRGTDTWIAISIDDRSNWDALAELAGGALVGIDPTNLDAADDALATWTATHDADDLAFKLQQVGVAAAAVATAPMVLADEHLVARGAFVSVDQPHVGPFTAPTTPIRFSATPLATVGPAPTLGEHNMRFLADNGFTEGEVRELLASAVIATEPPQ